MENSTPKNSYSYTAQPRTATILLRRHLETQKPTQNHNQPNTERHNPTTNKKTQTRRNTNMIETITHGILFGIGFAIGTFLTLNIILITLALITDQYI